MPASPRALSLVAALSLAGCTGELICPAVVLNPAIQVAFFDAATGALLAGPVRGALHDGQYSDSLEVEAVDEAGQPWLFGAVHGRPGTYRLKAERNGFHPVEVAGIRVKQDGCFASGEYVEARLTPMSGQGM